MSKICIMSTLGICIGITMIIIGSHFVDVGKRYAEDHKVNCVFTGEIHSPLNGYLYQCRYDNELRNFTSHYRPKHEPPYFIKMYQSCYNRTTLVNDKLDICNNYYHDTAFSCIMIGAIIIVSVPILLFIIYMVAEDRGDEHPFPYKV